VDVQGQPQLSIPAHIQINFFNIEHGTVLSKEHGSKNNLQEIQQFPRSNKKRGILFLCLFVVFFCCLLFLFVVFL